MKLLEFLKPDSTRNPRSSHPKQELATLARTTWRERWLVFDRILEPFSLARGMTSRDNRETLTHLMFETGLTLFIGPIYFGYKMLKSLARTIVALLTWPFTLARGFKEETKLNLTHNPAEMCLYALSFVGSYFDFATRLFIRFPVKSIATLVEAYKKRRANTKDQNQYTHTKESDPTETAQEKVKMVKKPSAKNEVSSTELHAGKNLEHEKEEDPLVVSAAV